MPWVVYYYHDTIILIKTNINSKHCPGLEFRLIPKLISWAGLKSNNSELVKLCSELHIGCLATMSIVPVTQEKIIQTEKGPDVKRYFLWINKGRGIPKYIIST